MAFIQLGLIGYPLGHSRSPALHQAALTYAGLEGDYRLFPVKPDESSAAEIGRLLERLRQRDLEGLNVTIPHKQVVIPMLDHLTEVARAVGAVNTIYVDSSGCVVGDNTDVPGFLQDVRKITGVEAGRALVLGAGGSARAVVFALAQAGWQVRVAARRMEQADALIDELSQRTCFPTVLSSEALVSPALLHPGCDLVVNTTPVGMHPHPDGCPWPVDIPLPDHAAVYDLVYNPLETVLVHRARAAGLRAANGAGMLVAQAALAFQRWTGRQVPFDVMMNAFYA